jgi:hypothetical protein
MIKVKHRGSFSNIESFFKSAKDMNKLIYKILDKYGVRGLTELSKSTPRDTSETSNSWKYSIKDIDGKMSLEFHNLNMADGVPVVILIEYGHGARDGSWIKGRPFIQQAIRPIFDSINREIGKEVSRL